MSDRVQEGSFDCERAREAIHRLLDSEIVDAEIKLRLQSHLEACGGCREFDADLRAIQVGLRAIPTLKLPDEALQEVLRQSRVPAKSSRFQRFAVAAAAVIVLALFGVWQWNAPPAGPTRAELERASREARMVLRLTAQAMRRTERVAVGEVLTEEVSPALRRVPIEWPSAGPAQRRGS